MAEKELKKICVNCENFLPAPSEVQGLCRVLPGDKPKQRNKLASWDMDASQCAKYQPLEFVRTDTSQVLDLHTRTLGGFEDVKSDRLVYEKHARGEKEGEVT